MKMRTSYLLGLFGLLVLSAPTRAQDSVSWTYGDWQVTCTQREDGLPCDMHQKLIDKTSGKTIVNFSIAYSPKEESYAIHITVPLGVMLEGSMAIQAGETTVEDIQFSRCLPTGCLVEARLEDPLLSAMSGGGEAAIGIIDASRKPAALPFSLKGFKEARAQLQSQTVIYQAERHRRNRENRHRRSVELAWPQTFSFGAHPRPESSDGETGVDTPIPAWPDINLILSFVKARSAGWRIGE